MPRLNRTKGRIAELEARIHANSEGLIDNKNYDFLWITLKSWRSIFDLASRMQIGIEDERSFAAWLRELK
jgi:hypothetical protein